MSSSKWRRERTAAESVIEGRGPKEDEVIVEVKYMEEVEQLLSDYDAYLAEIAPHTYQDRRRALVLRARKASLLDEEKKEAHEEAG